MGQAVARMSSTDTVAAPDGAGVCCVDPSVQSTDQGSGDVRVNGIGVVRISDAMITHLYPGTCCNPHAPILTTSSTTVRVNGRGLGRLNDLYVDHKISSGSPNVFCGG